MTKESGGETRLSDGGNLWDGDADSEGLRFLSTVASQFAAYAHEELRWIHSDPLAGKDAETQGLLGKRLEFVGQAMQRQAALRTCLMLDFGDQVLTYLAALAPDERADPDTIAAAVGAASTSVVLVLQDLARSEAVQVWRRRPNRIGDPQHPTLYAISEKGRLLLERSVTSVGRHALAIGDSTTVSHPAVEGPNQAPSHESR